MSWLIGVVLCAFALWLGGCPEDEGDDDVSDDDVSDDDSAVPDDDSATDDDDDTEPQPLGFEASPGAPVESADTRTTCLYDYNEPDGFLEVVLVNYAAYNVNWFSDGAGGYTEIEMDVAGSYMTTDCVIDDLDGDGQEDEIMVNVHAVTHFERTDAGYVDLSADLPTIIGAPTSVAAGDVNGDSRTDLVIGVNGGSDTLWLQDADGTFSEGGNLPNSYMQSQDVQLADLDADGLTEAIVASVDQCRVYTYNGTEFEAIYSAPLDAFAGCNAAAVGHLDADGNLDVVFACEGEDRAFLGDGALGLVATTLPRLVEEETSTGVALADFDLDGDDDLFIARDGVADILLVQDSPGVYSDASNLLPTYQDASTDVTVGDVDQDTDLDIVVAANGQTRLLLNQVYP